VFEGGIVLSANGKEQFESKRAEENLAGCREVRSSCSNTLLPN